MKVKQAPIRPVGVGFGVDQFDRAAVLFDDLGDDGEAEAGALLARRHIGLEQPMAVFLRPALAVVGNRDARHLALDLRRRR